MYRLLLERVVTTSLALLMVGVMSAAVADAAVIFEETFDGYTSFPSQNPPGDPINPGIPEISEGADEFWYAGRFEYPDNGTINQDLAVQGFGGGGNATPTGRVEDDAGIVFRIPAGFINVQLMFDWRTFLAETTDRFVVGYHIGDDLGFDTGVNRMRDFFGDFFTGNVNAAQNAVENWWNTEWVELLRASKNNIFTTETFNLPDTTSAPIWVALWLDNGEGDFAKIDNIKVTAQAPEPAAFLLLAFAAGSFAFFRRAPKP